MTSFLHYVDRGSLEPFRFMRVPLTDNHYGNPSIQTDSDVSTAWYPLLLMTLYHVSLFWPPCPGGEREQDISADKPGQV